MAIDMITYEFLKNYVEGSVMGNNARPRGIWKQDPNDGKGPYKEGDYITWNNTVYIWYNKETSTTKGNPEPGDGTDWKECWQEIIKAVVDEKLKNPLYEEDVKLTGITTVEGAMDAEITDNMLAGAGNSFHINITGHIKFNCHCDVDIDSGFATIMGVELGSNTGVYEYSFEGVIEDGFEVYCSFAGVTFTEFVKKIYVKDAIGDMDTALDAILAIQESIIGGVKQ